MPLIIIICLFLYDFLYKTAIGDNIYSTDYFSIYSVSINFVPIYLIAVANVIRLRIKNITKIKVKL